MAERPMLFSGPLVRAILDGRKTETRRLVTKGTSVEAPPRTRATWLNGHGWIRPRIEPDDTLWVRETWATLWGDADRCECSDLLNFGHCPTHDTIEYRADTGAKYPGDWGVAADLDHENIPVRWKPSIHMPRWAARLFLRVTEVRAERLQEITNDGAIAEGLARRPFLEQVQAYPPGTAERRAFSMLWDEINGEREGATWADNPWVWVIEFEVMP